MNNESDTRRNEPDQQRKRAAITQTITAYIQGEPSRDLFTFFLPTVQDLDLIKQAAAHSSLQTGKLIEVVYPGGREDEACERHL